MARVGKVARVGKSGKEWERVARARVALRQEWENRQSHFVLVSFFG